MTAQIPFPERIASASAETAARRYAERGPGFGESRTDRLAAYRLPCGTVRPAYDRYRPTYPRGSIPGVATFRETRVFYPNETSGFETTGGADFQPADNQECKA